MRSAFPTSGQKFVESTVPSVNQRTLLISLLPHVLSSQCISHKTAFFLLKRVCLTQMLTTEQFHWIDSYDCPRQSLHHSAIPLLVLCEFRAKEEVLWFLWHTARPWPGLPPIQGVKVCLVLLVQTQSLVFDIFFFPPWERFREERDSLCSMVVWCELLLQFCRVQPWSGPHVSERKSPGVEGV